MLVCVNPFWPFEYLPVSIEDNPISPARPSQARLCLRFFRPFCCCSLSISLYLYLSLFSLDMSVKGRTEREREDKWQGWGNIQTGKGERERRKKLRSPVRYSSSIATCKGRGKLETKRAEPKESSSSALLSGPLWVRYLCLVSRKGKIWGRKKKKMTVFPLPIQARSVTCYCLY